MVLRGTFAAPAQSVTNPPHGHYVRDVIGQLQLVCDPGYYGTSVNGSITPNHCTPIPQVAHGHYVKDMIGQIDRFLLRRHQQHDWAPEDDLRARVLPPRRNVRWQLLPQPPLNKEG